MKSALGRACGVVFALALAGAVAPLEGQDFEWSGTIARGDLLEVKGISGDVRVVRASGNRAEVRATKQGRERDFDDVEIVAVEGRDGITVCAIYFPRDRARQRCDGEDRGRDRGRHDRDIDVSVDFEVALPAGVELEVNTVVGDVEIEDVESDVYANTVSGNIWASTTGLVEARTVNGEIDIEIGTLDWRDLSFATVSGDITLTLPRSAETEVEFTSVSGDFDSDFDVRYTRDRDRLVGSHIEGVIGDGDRSLSFKTVSGDVRLLRGR